MTQLTKRSFLARQIEKRFGGYRHLVVPVDDTQPKQLTEKKSVAVIGAGIAGMSAAIRLAERGFDVTVYEKNDYIGGKIGSWPVELHNGDTAYVEHGFHAFFRHYYNLRHLFSDLEIDKDYAAMDDYYIMTLEKEAFRFHDAITTPILNLYDLARKGIYNFWKVAFSRTALKMLPMLTYNKDKTFKKFDHLSFEKYAQDAKLPKNLILIFNTFSRAFFAQIDRMSMAELMKSFHFFYLSNDHGLLYDYFDDDYEYTILKPMRDAVENNGGTILLDHPVEQIDRQEDGSFKIDGTHHDYMVMASDIRGAQHLLGQTQWLKDDFPAFAAQMEKQKYAQRYSVLRLWMDRDIDDTTVCPFLITERNVLLDAIAFYHRLEKESTAYVEKEGGAVLELHCYAVPDDIPEDEIRTHFLKELHAFFPELKDATIRQEYMQVRQDFTAYHVGQYEHRPTTETPVPNLFFAGDWVKLPYPAMLMEGACMSGTLAANQICQQENIQETPVWSVPPKGFFA
ncbi:MAG TPA: hypothetical protein DCE42_02845 [Myxococcales bacterium]|nr:hypothetical protein [Deltaproteobacteria bacterium]MBU48467.1 hypothetical protein [Deltaproteobacteria bacterium]HAA53663.1 hypothetical protein [Myxococcales bacterium]|tara:strand:+ start:1137 stop:2666 length:1530 start_codon:yes stop_codon:yes gene_type:complete